jgi:sarcosine oxidase gamma subunit
VRERTGVAVASIAARKGQVTALAEKVKSRTGLDLPSTPRIVTSDHLSFVWTAPGQWQAMADGDDSAIFAADLARDWRAGRSPAEQTAASSALCGEVRQCCRGCMLDLHDSVFSVGDTAIAPIAFSTQIPASPATPSKSR